MAKNKIRVQLDGDRYYDIKVVSNQRVVEVRKVYSDPNDGRVFDINANKKAMQELTPNAYTLYMYFVLKFPGYREALSISHIRKSTKISEKGYYKAFNELVAQKYLVKKDSLDFDNFFVFYEAGSQSKKGFK